MNRVLVVSLCTLAIVGCNEDSRADEALPSEVRVVEDQPEFQQTCDKFYDSEERGFTTRCFDIASNECYTLYEPDGDIEYYCDDEKIWEIEPDDTWDSSVGWAFAAGMALNEVSKPKYVSNMTVAKKDAPTIKPTVPKVSLAKTTNSTPITVPKTTVKQSEPVKVASTATKSTSTNVTSTATKSTSTKVASTSKKSTSTKVASTSKRKTRKK